MNKAQEEIIEREFKVSELGNNKLELETWTDGGVDIIIYINKDSVIEDLIDYIDNFDMDEEIIMYRQDERYRNDFTLKKSVDDFTAYQHRFRKIIKELQDNSSP